MRIFLGLMILILSASLAQALEVQKINDHVYALVGEMKQRSASNLGNNATFGVVLTDAGIVLIDAGGSWKGAEQIEKTIRTFSDKPVKIVINTGGQDHRWLGNGYWKAKGAVTIASQAAVEDHKERASLQLSMLRNFLGNELEGTEPVFADTTFENEHDFEMGGIHFALRHIGQAHTPGDSFVWLKDQHILFSGDIIYVERLLGVMDHSNTKSWLKSFEAIAALAPKTIIPGHGHVTSLQQAKQQTYQYLVNLREKMREHIDNGGDMMDAGKIDQSAFSKLIQFEMLSGRNAVQTYSQMEWED